MTLTSRTKTIIRWGGIGVFTLCYFSGLLIGMQSFTIFSENQTLVFSNPVPLNEYYQAIDSLEEAADQLFNAAIYGFIICVPLILLIFKKVR